MHKNVGITVLVLIIALLHMRLRQRPSPTRHDGLPGWMQAAARADHGMYVLTVVTAASGYLSSAFSGWPTRLWWLVDLPGWAGEDDTLNEVFSAVHSASCWALLLLIVVHLSGALYHAGQAKGLVRGMLVW